MVEADLIIIFETNLVGLIIIFDEVLSCAGRWHNLHYLLRYCLVGQLFKSLLAIFIETETFASKLAVKFYRRDRLAILFDDRGSGNFWLDVVGAGIQFKQ
ncbi:MAG: hypothetical protein ACD_39C01852G0002 [uncultured bacterium]|nr:MAG: hypothetical protein ACD_39C01852G0002 [uncultured bacterium]